MFTLKNVSSHNILDEAFTLFKVSFGKTFPLAFLGVFFSSLPRFLKLKEPLVESALFTICLLVGFVFFAAMIFRLYCTAYQIPHHAIHALKQALRKLLPLISLGLLYALIVLSGTLLLIVPGFILAISLMFSFILLIIDNQNILQSLMASHRLVFGNWWYAVFMMSFPFLINIIFFLGTSIALKALFMHFHVSQTHLGIYSFGLSTLVQAFIIPFVFSVALLLIYHLKQKANAYAK